MWYNQHVIEVDTSGWAHTLVSHACMNLKYALAATSRYHSEHDEQPAVPLFMPETHSTRGTNRPAAQTGSAFGHVA